MPVVKIPRPITQPARTAETTDPLTMRPIRLAIDSPIVGTYRSKTKLAVGLRGADQRMDGSGEELDADGFAEGQLHQNTSL
jgi:hypothetical protein